MASSEWHVVQSAYHKSKAWVHSSLSPAASALQHVAVASVYTAENKIYTNNEFTKSTDVSFPPQKTDPLFSSGSPQKPTILPWQHTSHIWTMCSPLVWSVTVEECQWTAIELSVVFIWQHSRFPHGWFDQSLRKNVPSAMKAAGGCRFMHKRLD